MPGYVVYSPFDGAPVPAANEQVRDELVSVFGYRLEPPELDDVAAEEEPAVETGDQAEATPAGDQALEENGEEAGGDDHEPARADLLRLQADQDH